MEFPNHVIKASTCMHFSINDVFLTSLQISNIKNFEVTPLSSLINWKLMTQDPLIDQKSYDLKTLKNIMAKHSSAISTPSLSRWFDTLREGLLHILLTIIAACIALLVVQKIFTIILYCIKKPVVAMTILPDDENRNQRQNNLLLSSLYRILKKMFH